MELLLIRTSIYTEKLIVCWEESLTKRQFINDLKHVYDKILRWTYTEYNGLSFKKFILFTAYEVNVEDKIITISINSKQKRNS